MKKKIFDKKKLLLLYEPTFFPNMKINQDVFIHKEFILLEKGETPEIINKTNNNTNYSNCFVIEEELEKAKGYGGKKNSQNFKGSQKLHNNNIIWSKNEPEENAGGFFDEFKGKTDEKQVSQFKRNLVNKETREGSLSIMKSVLIDHLSKDPYSNFKEQEVLNRIHENDDSVAIKANDKSKNIKHSDLMVNSANFKTTTITADNFFENADQLLAIKLNNTIDQTTRKELNSDLPTILAIPQKQIGDIFDIKNIHKINEYLQYPNDEPLWYIFHPVAKSSFGPITSKNIEEMYNGKLLNEKSEIRFIDVYTLKSHSPFKFFQLCEISKDGFIKEIEISSLLKIAVKIKSLEIQEKSSENKLIITQSVNGLINQNQTNFNHDEISANLKKESELINTDIIKSEVVQSGAKSFDPNTKALILEPKVTKEIIKAEELYSPESIYNIASYEQRQGNFQEVENEIEVNKLNKSGIKISNSRPTGESNVNLGKVFLLNIFVGLKSDIEQDENYNYYHKKQKKGNYNQHSTNNYHQKDNRSSNQINHYKDYIYKYDNSYGNYNDYYHNNGKNQRVISKNNK